jgi:Cys-tRNA synthase (O-phospho-L-seryl-tRNA:Cys-tRNA synthase)
MKKLLFSINILLFLSSILTCNGMKKSKATDGASEGQTNLQDSIITRMDSIIADSIIHQTDSLTKEEKYNNHEGGGNEAPKHDAPNQSKVDSIKNAKAKKKKKD